ncbi:hypothetical protein SeMB42_g07981 [Synchytrium endobioticum]|uniref:Uncharacterized protein n=1 Tax=Synchytrium endobioticum TaxID=286115 RepID=A0A507BSF7_9FUNG|nr:hypothetical protein SeMB42_g07981 [Synchytrium endobioticum]
MSERVMIGILPDGFHRGYVFSRCSIKQWQPGLNTLLIRNPSMIRNESEKCLSTINASTEHRGCFNRMFLKMRLTCPCTVAIVVSFTGFAPSVCHSSETNNSCSSSEASTAGPVIDRSTVS